MDARKLRHHAKSALASGRSVLRLPRRLLAAAIRGYQATLSPDHGPLRGLFPAGFCRHEPTCSEFARVAVLGRGAIAGSLLAIRRVLSCHPWAKIGDAKWRALARKTHAGAFRER